MKWRRGWGMRKQVAFDLARLLPDLRSSDKAAGRPANPRRAQICHESGTAARLRRPEGRKGLACKSPRLIAQVPLADIRAASGELDGNDVDALLQVGTALPTVAVAAEAERWLGKPVLAINTVSYWDSGSAPVSIALSATGRHSRPGRATRKKTDFPPILDNAPKAGRPWRLRLSCLPGAYGAPFSDLSD